MSNLIAELKEWRNAKNIRREIRDLCGRAVSEIERLSLALRESLEGELYSAYHAGNKAPEKNEWRSGGMSDAEWLCRHAGLELNKSHDATKLFASIPEIASRLAGAHQQEAPLVHVGMDGAAHSGARSDCSICQQNTQPEK